MHIYINFYKAKDINKSIHPHKDICFQPSFVSTQRHKQKERIDPEMDKHTALHTQTQIHQKKGRNREQKCKKTHIKTHQQTHTHIKCTGKAKPTHTRTHQGTH